MVANDQNNLFDFREKFYVFRTLRSGQCRWLLPVSVQRDASITVIPSSYYSFSRYVVNHLAHLPYTTRLPTLQRTMIPLIQSINTTSLLKWKMGPRLAWGWKAGCTGSVMELIEWLPEVLYEHNTNEQEKLCIVLTFRKFEFETCRNRQSDWRRWRGLPNVCYWGHLTLGTKVRLSTSAVDVTT